MARSVSSPLEFDNLCKSLGQPEYRTTHEDRKHFEESKGLTRGGTISEDAKLKEQKFLSTARAYLIAAHEYGLDEKLQFIRRSCAGLSDAYKSSLLNYMIIRVLTKGAVNLTSLAEQLAEVNDPELTEKFMPKVNELLDGDSRMTFLQVCRTSLGQDDSFANIMKNKMENLRSGLNLDNNTPRAWRVFCREHASLNNGEDIDQMVKDHTSSVSESRHLNRP